WSSATLNLVLPFPLLKTRIQRDVQWQKKKKKKESEYYYSVHE
uniref:Uncharacterized protein n=1 Tax=Loxodonta africana TaxID=9785 RepID=G3UIM0_LOXAF